MLNKGHEIAKVNPDSIGEEVGIESGDFLISINGNQLKDIIDYIELMENEEIEVYLKKSNGEELIIEIEKEPYEDLGIEFKEYLLTKEKQCGNNCVFCFVDQLPKKMRNTLYYKDDDWRLSFLMGNFITLTNMSDKEIDRIIDKRLSPLYISVHTTNPELRSKMLGNKRGGETLDYLKKLCDSGIKVHCQIVLCPGYNDGVELDRTIRDLWEYQKSIESLAAVPVGLTSYREGLSNIKPFDRESATDVINQIEIWQKKFYEINERYFVFPSDEFYILADKPFPDYKMYKDFPQIENGVGLVVKFEKEFEDGLTKYKSVKPQNKRVTVVTGISAYNIIRSMCNTLERIFNISIDVVQATNIFFGETVTVAGLLTGRDIISVLKGRELGDKVLIPNVTLRKGADVFLDDLTLEELISALDKNVVAVPVDGQELIKAVIEK